MKFNKNNWYWVGQWVQPVLSACFWDNWMHKELPFVCPRMHGRVLMVDGHTIVNKADMVALLGLIISNLNSDYFID